MEAERRTVNGGSPPPPPAGRERRSPHDQRDSRIRSLVHDMHNTTKALAVHREAGKRVRNTWPAFRVQQDGVRLVAGAPVCPPVAPDR